MTRCLKLVAVLATIVGCSGAGPEDPGSANAGSGGTGGATGGSGGSGGVAEPTPLFGTGTANLTVVAGAASGLDQPRDLSFHPSRTGELWVVNAGDRSVTIVFDARTSGSKTEHRIDGYAIHFMDNPSSIAYGAKTFDDDYTFGTCGESENTYDGAAPPNYFMGPVLWSSILTVFAEVNPIGLGSHLDMLHDSPDCMGIAHESDNIYWVFDGYHGQLVRYDFRKDHGPGMDDHSDGVIQFLDQPQVSRVDGVPSHLEVDAPNHLVYVADTGNDRVLSVDFGRVHKTADMDPPEPGNTVGLFSGAVVTELVPASAGLLTRPSGLALHGGVLYVGDNATSKILAFDLRGELLATLDTGLPSGALMGIEVGPDERFYLVDSLGNHVMRVEP